MVSHGTPKPAQKAGAASIPWAHSPLENTPHKAGIIGDGLIPALGALVAMAAEGGGAATRDGVQHFDMRPVQPAPAPFDEAGAAARMISATSTGGWFISWLA